MEYLSKSNGEIKVKKRKQNEWIYFFKGVACFAVICLHSIYDTDTIALYVRALCRFAVPFFFMVTGYFSFLSSERKKNEKFLRKAEEMLKMGLEVATFYFLVQLAICLFGDGGNTVNELLQRVFSIEALLNWLYFNVDPMINILWFIFAMGYVYGILYIIELKNSYKIAYRVIIPLLFVHFFCGAGQTLLGYDNAVPVYYYRNYLFFALPLTLLGHWLHQCEDYIISRVSRKLLLVCIILGELLALIEACFVGNQELYVGSVLTSSCMILFSVLETKRKPWVLIADLGRKYSLYVYILQIFAAIVLQKIGGTLYFRSMKGVVVIPFLILGSCVIFAKLWLRFLEIWNKLIFAILKKMGR